MNKNYLKVLGVIVLIVGVFVLGRVTSDSVLFSGAYTDFPNGVTIGGGTYAENPVLAVTGTTTFSAGTSFGSAGMPVQKLIFGTTTLCTLGTMGPSSINASHAATTTKVYDCFVSGARSGDAVFASLSTSTAFFGGWSVVSAKASSTNDYVEIGIYNGTGAAAIPSTQSVGSSTNVLIVR